MLQRYNKSLIYARKKIFFVFFYWSGITQFDTVLGIFTNSLVDRRYYEGLFAFVRADE